MSAAPRLCFHCGEPVSRTDTLHVHVDGRDAPVCCVGCKAVAELILTSGLADYYQFRTTHGPPANPARAEQYDTYDRPSTQARLTAPEARGLVVNLLVEGVRCSACSWLIGERLQQATGVVSAYVNPATAHAQVVFDPTLTSLGDILRLVSALGYRPHVLSGIDTAEVASRERRRALTRLAVAGFGTAQVMMISAALYIGAAQGMEPTIREYLRIISLIIAAPTLAYSGQSFFVGAVNGIRNKHVGMDVPVSLAIVLAFLASTWNTLRHSGPIYFDSIAMFVFLLLISRFVEMTARQRACSTTEALLKLMPATALKVDGVTTVRVPVDELAVGDRIRVPLGESFPADGTILTGSTLVDESLLTGEPLPVSRQEGDRVIAGALNCEAPVDVCVQRIGATTTLAAIVTLLEHAQTTRPRIARLADLAATRFVAAVLLAAVLVAVGWFLVDPARAFEATLAVLVATCPCALSLATPVVITAAANRFAQAGMLLTSADALEALAHADTIVFDKTGTLTEGRPAIDQVVTWGISKQRALEIAASLERHSSHPYAQAFSGLHAVPAEAIRVTRGQGIEGVIGRQTFRLGTSNFSTGKPAAHPEAHPGVFLGCDGRQLAHITFKDPIRSNARRIVGELRRLGLRAIIASGDHQDTVDQVAHQLAITHRHGRLLPEDKLALVRDLQASGAHVLAVGDGVNDAPILKAASVSVALGSGAALAQASADLVTVRHDLDTLPQAIRISREARRIIRQNLIWATAYNLCVLPVAAAGVMPPWVAAIGMSLSSLLVVINAMRLSRSPAPARSERRTARGLGTGTPAPC